MPLARSLLPALLLLSLARAPLLQAQQGTDALLVPGVAATPAGVVVETRLERDLNRYRYDALLTLGLAHGGWTVTGAQRFTSDAFEIFGSRLTFRDEINSSLRVLRALSPRTQVGVATRTAAFSQSRVLAHEAVGLLALHPRADLAAEVEAGLSLDQRPGVAVSGDAAELRTDAGPGVAARLAFLPTPESYALAVRARAGWAALTPRRAAQAGVEVTAQRQVETTRFGVRVLASRLRRDAYQAASFLNRADARQAETIEATTSDTLVASITLEAPLVAGLQHTSQLDLQANARHVRTERADAQALFFDTDFTRQSLAYAGAVGVERTGGLARLQVQTGAETERRTLVNRDALPPAQAAQKRDLLRQADFDRGFLTLSLLLRGRHGSVTAFTDVATSILRHDTPDANPDDRDEAHQTLQAGLQWRIRPALLLDATFFGSVYHTVYLKRERSGENNRQQSLRLRPAVTWVPGEHSRVRLTSEVRATYTTADVVLPGRMASDQAARELRYEVEAEHALAPPLRVMGRATLSDLRLGRLSRDRFAEIPFDTLRTYTLDARFQLVRRFTAELGLRLFLRRDSDRSLTLRYPRTDASGAVVVDADGQVVQSAITRAGRSWRRQMGPVVRVSWPLGSASTLQLDGWYSVQRLTYVLFGALPPDDAPAIRAAARRGQRDVFPNLSVAVRWRLQ